jgi:hypothetical protein
MFPAFEEPLSKPCEEDALAHRRPAVVVLRLVLHRGGGLSHGEILDARGRPRGRFADWDGLVRALRAWLEHDNEQGIR